MSCLRLVSVKRVQCFDVWSPQKHNVPIQDYEDTFQSEGYIIIFIVHYERQPVK